MSSQPSMGAPIGVVVLGSTGTIGDNTLDVIARHPDRFRVVALGAHRNATKLLAQCRQFKPAHAVLVDPGVVERGRQPLERSGQKGELLVVGKLPALYVNGACIHRGALNVADILAFIAVVRPVRNDAAVQTSDDVVGDSFVKPPKGEAADGFEIVFECPIPI